MSWSYQDTMPRSIDKVRFYCGDTNSADQQLTDEEIQFALDEAGAPRSAAAICCDRLAAYYVRLVDKTIGSLRITYSQRYQQYHNMAVQLRSRAAYQAMPTAGAVLVADKQANQEDDTLVTPSFNVDILDNELVGKLDTTQGTISEETD